MKRLFTFMILLITVFSINLDCSATTITAVVPNGMWKTAATWDLGREPECGDTIVIPLLINVRITKTVDLDNADPLCAATKLVVSGSLLFSHGVKLRLAEGACVVATLGGLIIPSLLGGGASENISIDSDNIWQSSNGILVGPASFGCSVLLPVSLTSFSVTSDEEAYILSWKVMQEYQLDFYEVFVSETGSDWTSIKQQDAVGNSASEQNYQFRYTGNATEGHLYFKLEAIDIDGNRRELSIQTTELVLSGLLKENEIRVYPNPTSQNSILNLIFKAKSTNDYKLEISDFSGKVILEQSATPVKGKNVVLIETGNLIRGNYIVRLKTEEFCSNQKITVL